MVNISSMFRSFTSAALSTGQASARSKAGDLASSFLQKIGVVPANQTAIRPLSTSFRPQQGLSQPIMSARINFNEVSPVHLSGMNLPQTRIQIPTYRQSQLNQFINRQVPQAFVKQQHQVPRPGLNRQYHSEYTRPHQTEFAVFRDDTQIHQIAQSHAHSHTRHFEIFRDDTHLNQQPVSQNAFSIHVDETGLCKTPQQEDTPKMGFSAIPTGEQDPYTFYGDLSSSKASQTGYSGGLSNDAITQLKRQLTTVKKEPLSNSACLNSARKMPQENLAQELDAFTKKQGGDLEENFSYGHHLFSQSEDFKNTLEPHEAASMTVYSLNSFKKMNTLLRSNSAFEQMPVAERKGWTQMISSLDTALAKCQKKPSLTYQGLVTRRGTLSEEILKNLKVGSIYSDSGFMSTSVGPGGNMTFYGNATFKIQSKTGVLLKGQSDNPDELEALFRPDTQFVIKSILPKPGGSVLITMDEK